MDNLLLFCDTTAAQDWATPNNGNVWSAESVEWLLAGFAAGNSAAFLARALGRTLLAVCCKLESYGRLIRRERLFYRAPTQAEVPTCTPPTREVPTQIEGEVIMNPTTKTPTLTLTVDASVAFLPLEVIYGHEVSAMAKEQFIEALRRVNAEIDDLKSIKGKSKAIASAVASLKAQRDTIVVLFDTRFGE